MEEPVVFWGNPYNSPANLANFRPAYVERLKRKVREEKKGS